MINSTVKLSAMSNCYIEEVREDFLEDMAFGLSLNDKAPRHENTCVPVPSAGDGTEGREWVA